MGQQLREGRKPPTIGPDVDVGYGDAPFLARRVGVRAYTQTTGMWVRGMLAEPLTIP